MSRTNLLISKRLVWKSNIKVKFKYWYNSTNLKLQYFNRIGRVRHKSSSNKKRHLIILIKQKYKRYRLNYKVSKALLKLSSNNFKDKLRLFIKTIKENVHPYKFRLTTSKRPTKANSKH